MSLSTMLGRLAVGAAILASILAGHFGIAPASAEPAPPFDGAHWSIVEVYGEKLPQDEAPYIAFEDDGKFSGRTACNWFHGTYTENGGAIVLLTRLTTLRGCLVGTRRRPDATLEALDSTASFSLSGSTLTLSDDSGEPVARLEKPAGAAAPAP